MKENTSRLSLKKHTLRSLEQRELRDAAGGLWILNTERCGSGIPGCSAKCASACHLTCSATHGD